MNALANSQMGKLSKVLKLGFPDNKPLVTFERYTGQESDEEKNCIMANPPDILLTNYVIPDASDPETPGQRKISPTYIPIVPDEYCLCGSGLSYADCCRASPIGTRPALIPDSGSLATGAVCSLVSTQSATFRDVNGPAVRERLMEDERLL